MTSGPVSNVDEQMADEAVPDARQSWSEASWSSKRNASGTSSA